MNKSMLETDNGRVIRVIRVDTNTALPGYPFEFWIEVINESPPVTVKAAMAEEEVNWLISDLQGAVLDYRLFQNKRRRALAEEKPSSGSP